MYFMILCKGVGVLRIKSICVSNSPYYHYTSNLCSRVD